MRVEVLPNGNLLVPMRAETEDGSVKGDGMVEIDAKHPDFKEWQKWLQSDGRTGVSRVRRRRYAVLVDRPPPDFARGDDLLEASFEYAREKHAGDYRRGAESEGERVPYIEHPVEVARLVSDASYPAPVVAAALLHDVVEDADPPVRPEEIDERFGVAVGTLVRALTENKLLDFGDKADPRIYELRKQLHREKVEVAGEPAQAIYAADKLANVRDVTEAVHRDGPQVFDEFNVAGWSTYVKKSRGELAMLRRVASGMPLLDDLERALVDLESACSAER